MEWLQAALTIVFGALAGGLTNRVAVWMLFHPYVPPAPLGRTIGWLQGAVPKNRKRIADSVGGVVGGALLTPEDIASELGDLEDTFRERLHDLALELTEGELPALADVLPEDALVEIRRLLMRLLAEGRGLLADTLDTPEFGEEASRLVESVLESLSEDRLSDTVDVERIAAARQVIEDWLVRLVDSGALDTTVRWHLNQAVRHILKPGNTLEQLIPPGVVAALEHALKDYLPLAMERLGRLLEDPATRARVERMIGQLLERFMRDLRFHQRVVAKLIVTQETVTRALNTLEAEGADRMGEVLREPEVQEAMTRNVNEAVVEFLRRPTSKVLGGEGGHHLESTLDSIAKWLVAGARNSASRSFLLDQIEGLLARLGERSWADVLRAVPAERVAGWAAVGLRSDPGRVLFDSVAEPLADRMLNSPVGRLDRFLRENAAGRLADILAPPAWAWIAGQVPEVAKRIRIADRISAKIEAFPLQQLEKLVRDISQRELDLIIRLGYLLGGVIGTILVLLQLVLR